MTGRPRQVPPFHVAGQAGTGEERYITRLHRVARNANADGRRPWLGHFKSIRRRHRSTAGATFSSSRTLGRTSAMMNILEDLMSGGGRPDLDRAHPYSIPERIRGATQRGLRPESRGSATPGKAAGPAVTCTLRRFGRRTASNSVRDHRTERAYLRILEFI